MPIKHFHPIDLLGNELRNAVIHTPTFDPNPPQVGQIWRSATDGYIRYCRSTNPTVEIIILSNSGTGGGSGGGTTIIDGIGAPATGTGQNGNYYLDTATHTLYGPKSGTTWPVAVSGVTPETVGDTVAALLVAGPGIVLTYDDTAGTMTISATSVGGGGSQEVFLQPAVPPDGTTDLIWIDIDDTSLEGGGGGGSGGGTAYTRTSAVITTASLAAGAAASGTVTLAKGYRLLKISTSRPARVRLYTTSAKRDADVSRTTDVDPTGDHGLVLEYVTTASVLSADLSPTVDGYDGKTTPDGVIGYRITNLDSATGTVVVTFTWLRTE